MAFLIPCVFERHEIVSDKLGLKTEQFDFSLRFWMERTPLQVSEPLRFNFFLSFYTVSYTGWVEDWVVEDIGMFPFIPDYLICYLNFCKPRTEGIAFRP